MRIGNYKDVLLFKEAFPGNICAGVAVYPITGTGLHDKMAVLEDLSPEAGAAYLDQVHGPDVIVADDRGEYPGDGIFTKNNDLALFIRTADCLPLLFHSERYGITGAVHMGWRPAEAGILDNIPYDMKTFKVVAGPGMRKCCFRVGGEFGDKDCFKGFMEARNGNLFLDPVSFARECLTRRGLRPENFIDTGICSFCSGTEGLYSFRKTGTEYRNLSFIVHR